VSNLLSLEPTLDHLARLRQGIARCREAAGRVEGEFKERIAKLNRQTDVALRETNMRLADDMVAEDEAARQAASACQARHDRRKERILQARQAVESVQLKRIGDEEAREVFHVQREMLQVSRDHQAGQQLADATYASLKEEWADERDRVEKLERAAGRAFLGFRCYRNKLRSACASPGPAPAGRSKDMLELCRDRQNEAYAQLRRLRRSPLPGLFTVVSPWLCAVLLVAGHALLAILPLLRDATFQPGHMQPLAVSLAVSLVALFALHALARKLARPTAAALVAASSQALHLVEAGEQAAWNEHAQEQQRIEEEARSKNSVLEDRWHRAVDAAAAQRTELKASLGTKLHRALGRGDRLRLRASDRLQREHAARAAALNQAAAEQRTALEQERERRVSELRTALQDSSQALVRDWAQVTGTAYAAFEGLRNAAAESFPDWASRSWDDWSPPSASVSAAPFASVTLDVAAYVGGLPSDPRLVLPGPAQFDLRLLLKHPEQGSIVIETQAWGRAKALAALNAMVLRLLMSAPPGRVLFTILDPVGLGETFAGLMHLSDHEDRLINRRIWTQPDQIEQRLADLNEHIEKVTQLYLRNEYATIADYNAQAGRIAEPYHFLVAADFPVNFSESAAKRLLSIASSGPRCGVFLLLHWDRRKPLPAEAAPEDLRKAGARIAAVNQAFELEDPRLEGIPLRLEEPPPPETVTTILTNLGQASVDSNRVEMPFAEIAPDTENLWTLDTTHELRVAIGVTGATKLQYLALGKGTRQHALVAGKTGSGKSTLFHVLVTNLALWCSPHAIEFYLVDFKKGVEFKCYGERRLPHARVVAIESDREFGLSVLERLDQELQRRGDLFRQAGVQDLPAYHRASPDNRLPRALLIIDEFQEFFTEDDRVAQNAALLLDRLVRQGRAFGIHVMLGSQTLGGAYTLTRTTLGQMVVRIALQCNQPDAMLIMDDDNAAPHLLSRPGEAIYNDAAGAIEGNSPFQIVWLPEAERNVCLETIQRRAERVTGLPPPPVVFEGNAPADVRENRLLEELLRARPQERLVAPRIYLGAPNSIKGPTEIALHRQSGNHVLIVGQYDEPALAMLGLALIALAAQHPPGTARFLLLDATPAAAPHRAFLERVTALIPHDVRWVGNTQLDDALGVVGAELAARSDPEAAAAAPSVYLCIHHLERFKRLRFEEDFSLALDSEEKTIDPGRELNRLLCEGAHVGLHALCLCDTYNNVSRFFSRRALTEFELRILFQMSPSDSASLIDSPKASTLGLHRAVLHNAQAGSLETFRPYALPDPAWLDRAKTLLSDRTA
jgi:hypothetical protein